MLGVGVIQYIKKNIDLTFNPSTRLQNKYLTTGKPFDVTTDDEVYNLPV